MWCHVIVVNFKACNCIPTSIFHFIVSTNKVSFQFQFLKDIWNWVLVIYPRMVIGWGGHGLAFHFSRF